MKCKREDEAKVWSEMPGFHRKGRRVRAKALSPALRCATAEHSIYSCFLCQLVVLHFQHPAPGVRKRLTLLFDYCFVYSENKNPALVSKTIRTEEVKHASESCLLIEECVGFFSVMTHNITKSIPCPHTDCGDGSIMDGEGTEKGQSSVSKWTI